MGEKGPAPGRKPNNPKAAKGQLLKPFYIESNEHANREWDRMLPVLEEMGMMSPTYHAMFSAYCMRYAQWIVAEMEAADPDNETATDARDGKKRSPYLVNADKALESLIKLATEFGLTPRSKAHVFVDLDIEDDFDEFMDER